MNSRKKLWKVCSRATVVVLLLALVSVQAPIWVQAHDDDDRPTVSVPLFCTGLVFGQSLRTTLINRGTRSISAHISVFDADGVVVRSRRWSWSRARCAPSRSAAGRWRLAASAA